MNTRYLLTVVYPDTLVEEIMEFIEVNKQSVKNIKRKTTFMIENLYQAFCSNTNSHKSFHKPIFVYRFVRTNRAYIKDILIKKLPLNEYHYRRILNDDVYICCRLIEQCEYEPITREYLLDCINSL